MRDPVWTHWEFYAAILLGVVVKLMASKKLTIWGAAAMTIVAILSAVLFTDPVVAFAHHFGLNIPAEEWRYALAAIIAITSDQIARRLAAGKIGEVLGMFRGGK